MSAPRRDGGVTAMVAPDGAERGTTGPCTTGGIEARVTMTVTLPAEAITVIAPPPDMISQHNVAQVLGIPPRVYLEMLREPGCPLRVARLGKLRIVDRLQLRSWLISRPAVPAQKAANDAEDSDTVAELSRLGYKPVPRAERS